MYVHVDRPTEASASSGQSINQLFIGNSIADKSRN